MGDGIEKTIMTVRMGQLVPAGVVLTFRGLNLYTESQNECQMGQPVPARAILAFNKGSKGVIRSNSKVRRCQPGPVGAMSGSMDLRRYALGP